MTYITKGKMLICPDCGRSFMTLTNVKQHATQTGCNIQPLLDLLFTFCIKRMLAASKVAHHRVIS